MSFDDSSSQNTSSQQQQQQPETYDFASSAVQSATYDPAQQTMQITFASGGTYPYRNVPPDVWANFKGAASPGRFVRDFIKGQYE